MTHCFFNNNSRLKIQTPSRLIANQTFAINGGDTFLKSYSLPVSTSEWTIVIALAFLFLNRFFTQSYASWINFGTFKRAYPKNRPRYPPALPIMLKNTFKMVLAFFSIPFFYKTYICLARHLPNSACRSMLLRFNTSLYVESLNSAHKSIKFELVPDINAGPY